MASVLVLVVEDEFLVRLHAVSLLEAAGFSTLAAGDADEPLPGLKRARTFELSSQTLTCLELWTG